jgi:hypothetical protein
MDAALLSKEGRHKVKVSELKFLTEMTVDTPAVSEQPK